MADTPSRCRVQQQSNPKRAKFSGKLIRVHVVKHEMEECSAGPGMPSTLTNQAQLELMVTPPAPTDHRHSDLRCPAARNRGSFPRFQLHISTPLVSRKVENDLVNYTKVCLMNDRAKWRSRSDGTHYVFAGVCFLNYYKLNTDKLYNKK